MVGVGDDLRVDMRRFSPLQQEALRILQPEFVMVACGEWLGALCGGWCRGERGAATA